MNWATRLDSIEEEHRAAVQRFENRIHEIDERVRAALLAVDESESDEPDRHATAERDLLLRQDALARAVSQQPGNRQVYVLPPDWTDEDEARWRE
ncbi:hypothetical protein H0264_37645 [Nocardia huaxiensis]|uniref:Uncharacterized protein n=1 Tax=Nocardia huaxiensis TaxID=2755382 RepID=A0A7D6VAG2_9NOCA|nr:hypothetical protein [Nocardia huaxiensis]QLY30754.1 hypothetical protein H0264_37645 [Nocardia huaxiensis]